MGLNDSLALLAICLLLGLHHLSTFGWTPSTLEECKSHNIKGS